MGNQGSQGGLSNNYSQGWKNNQNQMGGNKTIVHPTSKGLSNSNINQIIHPSLTE